MIQIITHNICLTWNRKLLPAKFMNLSGKSSTFADIHGLLPLLM